jgi:hypothetical protein
MPANNTGSSPDALGAAGFADTKTRKLDQAGDPAAGCRLSARQNVDADGCK